MLGVRHIQQCRAFGVWPAIVSSGAGVRGAARMTGAGKGTILNVLTLVGERCRRYMEDAIVSVPVKDVQADELWSFVYCKEKTRKRLSLPLLTHGDQYCFVGMERHNKLVLAWHMGNRELVVGREFVAKLEHACWKQNFQITTDGWRNYKQLMGTHFSGCDFGMLIKIFNAAGDTTRYSPGTIIEFKKKSVQGTPDEDRMCTSHVERANLTIRMDRKIDSAGFVTHTC